MPLIGGTLVVVRGAGDLGTGVIVRLVNAGFCVVALEAERPSAIRRTVSLSEAMYDGTARVEGVRAVRCESVPESWAPSDVPLLPDPDGRTLERLSPVALVDAIVAKRNLGTRRGMAPVVVALGPGFTAGLDADAVVETKRGHDLGRVILDGAAAPNTGVPGVVGGHDRARVVHAPVAGRAEPIRAIGDTVAAGDPILAVAGSAVPSPIAGVVRGLIRPGFDAQAGLKVADVDPRCVRAHCFSISDKARAVAGGVLEAILMLAR